jgi:L-lactate dehydrogenase complex protein LldE
VFASADVIVTPSASCAAMVRDQATGLRAPVYELSEFLVQELGVDDVGAYYPHRVTYHPTCHSLRLLKVGDAPLRLLRNVRGLELVELGMAQECCGFGGTFAIKFPGVSTAMGRDKVNHVHEAGAGELVSGDLGCLMHLGGVAAENQVALATTTLPELLVREGWTP